MPFPRLPGLLLFLTAVIAPGALSAQDAKTLFTMHCAACHLPDRQLVGPSLVEIRTLYDGKEAEFLAWCKEPQQKRQGVIQMPPMAHVGEDNLKLIHAHILEAAKGLKEVKVKGQDPFYASPSMRKRPLIQRIFMPNAGPAAIAVAVNDELHYCWDAGECRLRYVWKGDFIDGWAYWRGNGNGLAKVQGDLLLREERSPVPSLASAKPRFLGYTVKDGLPTFRYRAGDAEITERITATEDGKALARTFTFEGTDSHFPLTFTAAETISYSSDDGNWSEFVLTVKKPSVTVTLTPR